MIEGEGLKQFQAELVEFMARLEDFPEIAAGQVELAIEQALMVLQGDAADYPAAPADSWYRRTGTLGRLWVSGQRVVEMAPGNSGAFVVGRVDNATPYGPYVMDPQKQTPAHRGRWRTTAQVVADNQEAINGLLAQAGAGIVAELAEEVGG